MTELEQIIGYTFKNPELLKEALTHSSYTSGKHLRSNERLEDVYKRQVLRRA